MEKKTFDTTPRLARVTNKEWLAATESVKRLITWRLFGGKQQCIYRWEIPLGVSLFLCPVAKREGVWVSRLLKRVNNSWRAKRQAERKDKSEKL